MTKQIKVKFGKGEVVLTKSKKYVGIKKAQTRSLEAEARLDPEIDKLYRAYLGGFEIVSLNTPKKVKIDTHLDDLRLLDEVEVGTHVYHLPGSDKPLVPTGSIYITFMNNIPTKTQELILAELNLKIKERRDDDKVVAVVSAESPNPLKCAMHLQAQKEVKWAEPDIDTDLDFYAFSTPSAALWRHMWHLQNVGTVPDNSNVRLKPGADAKVLEAWRLLDGFGNPNIVVAVIDNGFDIMHPDLNSKVVKPWDLWDNSPRLRRGDPSFTHGTPCASVAIAPFNIGMCGSAPVARFMPLSGTGFSIESTEAMFNYVIRNGADVVSCSWGTVDSNFQLGPDKIAAISKAAREGRGGRGCVICYAAGNEDVDFVNFYGAHPDVICVGASDSDDQHASYSNRGRELTVCAPSNGAWPVLAARASWDQGIPGEVGAARWYYGDGKDRGAGYQHFGGTSSSTPLVAGICALILSANPNLTAREVKQILIQTADKIGSPGEYVNGHSLKYGFGRVNAANAVREALRRAGKPVGGTTPTPSPSTPTTPSTPASNPSGVIVGTGLFRFSTRLNVSNKGFAVQVGSFSQWSNVMSIAPNLESRFKQPALVHVAGSGPTTTIYRVLIGQFTTLSEANKLMTTMKAAGVSGFVKDLSTLSA